MNNIDEQNDIELDIFETNELLFSVKIQGNNIRPKSRLLIKSENVVYCFEGFSVGDNTSFIVNEGIIKEEGTYQTSVEVIVGNKILVPLKFNTVFKQSIKSKSNLIETNVRNKDITCNVSKVKVCPTLKQKWLAKKVSKN